MHFWNDLYFIAKCFKIILASSFFHNKTFFFFSKIVFSIQYSLHTNYFDQISHKNILWRSQLNVSCFFKYLNATETKNCYFLACCSDEKYIQTNLTIIIQYTTQPSNQIYWTEFVHIEAASVYAGHIFLLLLLNHLTVF